MWKRFCGFSGSLAIIVLLVSACLPIATADADSNTIATASPIFTPTPSQSLFYWMIVINPPGAESTPIPTPTLTSPQIINTLITPTPAPASIINPITSDLFIFIMKHMLRSLGFLALPWMVIAFFTLVFNQNRIALPIISLSLSSVPFFNVFFSNIPDFFNIFFSNTLDFSLPIIITRLPFLYVSLKPVSYSIAFLIALITGNLGWIIGQDFVAHIRNKGKKNSRIILLGLFCGFIAGILAALIMPPPVFY